MNTIKNIARSVLLLILMVCPCCFMAAGADHAYALRFQQPDPDTLVMFDVESDSIIKEIRLPDDNGFNNFVVDEKGGCYISNLRLGESFFRDIYYYDSESQKIAHFKNLRDVFGPKRLFMNDKEIIAEVTGNDRTRLHSGIIFIDRGSKKLTGSVFLEEEDPLYIQANINKVFYDGASTLFLASFNVLDIDNIDEFRNCDGTGDIYVIDTDKKKIIKKIKLDRQYKDIDGICAAGDKIYVTAGEKGRPDPQGRIPINDELLVYSLSTSKLIRTIKVSPHPSGLTYDRSVGKIYVMHRNDVLPRRTVEIIDVKSDKVIGKLNVPSQLMFSVVGPGKMYITAGEEYSGPEKAMPRLLVLDTRTDKIIKQFDGAYTGISLNPKY